MMNKSWRKGVVALAVSAALGMSSVAIHAADSTGGIMGSITSASAPAGGYLVTIKNPQTGFSRELNTDASGAFRFPQLPIGTYEVSVTQDGKLVGKQEVRVSIGGMAVARFDLADRSGAEVIEVVGARPSAVDLTSTDSGLVVGEAEIDKLPVARNLTAVALLAPGTVKGDSDFGNLASFGGSSVAENSCYVNGMNITNTRTGLGCSSMPFEMYKEFQVKTGGYSAMFGRTTGGVINSVTKSGTNEWQFGATVFHNIDNVMDEGQLSRGSNGVVFRNFSKDETTTTDMTFSVSGPIIEDKLFIYALVNPRNLEQQFSAGGSAQAPQTTFTKREATGGDNLFWTAKIDFEITDSHRLEYFGFGDEQTTESTDYTFNAATGAIGNRSGGITLERGGEMHSLKYNGQLTDDLSVSVMHGKYDYSLTNFPENLACPSVVDNRAIPEAQKAKRCGSGVSWGPQYDSNELTRLDFEWALGDHILRFGMDNELRSSEAINRRIGGFNYTYNTISNGGVIQGIGYVNNTGAPFDYVSARKFEGGGGFETVADAMYIEDQWQVTPDLQLTLGFRTDTFENKTIKGTTFVESPDQEAPRIGMTWDPFGEGEDKLFFNYGKYYLPIANNTNFRAASGIVDETRYYRFTGINAADGTPTGLTQIVAASGKDVQVNSSGALPSEAIAHTEELEGYYQTEFILGYQKELSPEYTATIRGTYRDLGSVIDDYCGDLADWCILLNPGKGGTWHQDLNHDGQPDPNSRRYYSAEEIGLPEAHREYHAIQLELSHRSPNLRWDFIYTWGRSFGNFEGAVKSDNNQADFGITQDFDFPALMDGAEGYLPNDRRHVFKFYGAYNITDDLSVGWNATLQDGRPYSAFGRSYPILDDHLYGSYGDTYWLRSSCPDTNGNKACDPSEKVWTKVERGEAGRTPWTFNMDVTFAYNFTVAGVDMTASADIFNLFGTREIVQINEFAEASEGVTNAYFRTGLEYQAPRSIRVGLEARF